MSVPKNPFPFNVALARGASCGILFACRRACLAFVGAGGITLGFGAQEPALALEPAVHCSEQVIRDGTGCHDDMVETTRRNAEADSNILQLLLSWQACFTKEEVTDQNVETIIEACDRAATSSNLSRKERERLTYRRGKILQAASKTQAPAAGKGGAEGQ